MTPAALLALAERVSRETPTRQLDERIERVANPKEPYPRTMPAYTTSLDAAASLAPNGWTTDITDWDDPAGSWECTLSHPLLPLKAVGRAPTEPRARTAAALRARAQEMTDG